MEYVVSVYLRRILPKHSYENNFYHSAHTAWITIPVFISRCSLQPYA